MEKITYIKGQYSQLKLEDGSRILVETLPEMVRVKKMILGIIPTETVWEFKFYFYIRTVGEAWDLAKEILDLVLASIENCKTIEEIRKTLRSKTNQLLAEYVKSNEERAITIGIEKLGSFAAKKYLGRFQKFKDVIAIPSDIMQIIGEYGKVLEELGGMGLHPISKLPYSKDKIKNALNVALKIVTDKEFKGHLEMALSALENFVPDNEVPKNLVDNLKAWAENKRRKENK